jgi:flagellar biosynthesis GTPase FlhF
MAARKIESEIDRLYQLGPDEFTAARNALAKSAGPDAAAIKRLTKPPIAAWAVNQIYWHHRDVYDALVTAAKELRQTHKTILAGRAGDLRSAGKAHEAAVDQALKTAVSLLAENGHPATDTTRQAIATTLRALPSHDAPGRLSATLQPGGFEMLAGLSIGGGQAGRASNKVPVAPKETAPARAAAAARPQPGGAPFHRKTTHTPPKAPDPKAVARAKEAAAKAARELREAEHTARREEFESARATREAEKAARQLEQAREALAAAQSEVEAAEAAAAEAERKKNSAEQRAEAAERALEEAKRKAEE